MITIEIIVMLVLLFVQLFLAVGGMWRWRVLERRYRIPLTSRVSVAELLEKYSRIYSQLNIRVNADISEIAKAGERILYVNRERVYEKFVFSGIYTQYQIILLRPEHRLLRKMPNLQTAIFLLELSFLALAFTLHWVFIFATIITAGLLLLSSLVASLFMTEELVETVETATDLLELDKIEQRQAIEMAEDLRSEMFLYPLIPLVRVLNFIIPGRRFKFRI